MSMNINLLPSETASARYGYSIRAAVVGGLSAVAVTFAALAISNLSNYNANQEQLQSLQSQFSDTQAKTVQLQARLQSETAVLHPTVNPGLNVDVHDFFLAVENKAPSGTTFNSLSMTTPSQLTLSGAVSSLSALSAYEVSLQSLKNVAAVWVSSANQADSQISFSMTIAVGGAGK